MSELKEARDKMIGARISLQKQSPFFSYLAMHLKFVERDEICSAGVDGEGHLYYNKKWIEQFPIDQVKAVLCHEVMHLVLEHNIRCAKRIHRLYNVAADLVINDILVNNNFDLPKTCLIPREDCHEITLKDFGMKIKNLDKKTAEEVYDELFKRTKKERKEMEQLIIEIDFSDDSEKSKNKDGGQSGQDSGDGKDTAPTQSKIGSDEQKVGKKLSKAKNQDGISSPSQSKIDGHDSGGEKKVNWKKVLVEAGLFARMRGQIPLGMERYFDRIFGEKLNWRELLQRHIVNHIPYDYSYMRPAKKSVSSGYYIPSIRRENIEIIVSIDTSGSISKENITEFLSEVYGILKSFNNIRIILLSHDVEVHDEYELQSISDLDGIKIRGGGGTSHVPLFKFIRNKYPNAELLISITDGYTEYPKQETVNTIFVINNNHQTPPFGEVIRLIGGGEDE